MNLKKTVLMASSAIAFAIPACDSNKEAAKEDVGVVDNVGEISSVVQEEALSTAVPAEPSRKVIDNIKMNWGKIEAMFREKFEKNPDPELETELKKVMLELSKNFDGSADVNTKFDIEVWEKGKLPPNVYAAFSSDPENRRIVLVEDFDIENKIDLLNLLHELQHAAVDSDDRKKWGMEKYERYFKLRNRVIPGTDLYDEAAAILFQIKLMNLLTDGELDKVRDECNLMEKQNTDNLPEAAKEFFTKTFPIYTEKVIEKLNGNGEERNYIDLMLFYYIEAGGSVHEGDVNGYKVPRRFLDAVVRTLNQANLDAHEFVPNGETKVVDGVMVRENDSGMIWVYPADRRKEPYLLHLEGLNRILDGTLK